VAADPELGRPSVVEEGGELLAARADREPGGVPDRLEAVAAKFTVSLNLSTYSDPYDRPHSGCGLAGEVRALPTEVVGQCGGPA
jgi:hypothetical protein